MGKKKEVTVETEKKTKEGEEQENEKMRKKVVA